MTDTPPLTPPLKGEGKGSCSPLRGRMGRGLFLSKGRGNEADHPKGGGWEGACFSQKGRGKEAAPPNGEGGSGFVPLIGEESRG